jgi:hypothetical protein
LDYLLNILDNIDPVYGLIMLGEILDGTTHAMQQTKHFRVSNLVKLPPELLSSENLQTRQLLNRITGSWGDSKCG